MEEWSSCCEESVYIALGWVEKSGKKKKRKKRMIRTRLEVYL